MACNREAAQRAETDARLPSSTAGSSASNASSTADSSASNNTSNGNRAEANGQVNRQLQQPHHDRDHYQATAQAQ